VGDGRLFELRLDFREQEPEQDQGDPENGQPKVEAAHQREHFGAPRCHRGSPEDVPVSKGQSQRQNTHEDESHAASILTFPTAYLDSVEQMF
jgi:hypothetical protein